MGTKDLKKKQKFNKDNSKVGTPINFDSNNKNFWASIVLLVIMIASIAGFALSSGGGVNSGGDGNLPSEVPFQQFQDPNTNQTFWGAIKNNEQFIFLNITDYDNRTDLGNLAGLIRNQQSLSIYVDESFNSAESEFMFDKVLRGLQISSTRISNFTKCTPNTLVLTINNTYDGDCIVFNPKLGEEYKDSEILTYYLIQ